MVDTFPRQHARTQRLTLGAPRNFSVVADGERVIFLRSRGPEDPVTCLWILEPDAREPQLVGDPAVLLGASDEVELPAAERARRERAREGAAGIVAYSTDAAGQRAAFALAGRVYVVDLGGGAPRVLPTAEGVFDPRLSPDGQQVSYVVGDELHVVSADGADPGRAVATEDGVEVSWGSAEFIAAEEMRRSRGHWWSPDSQRLAVARVDVSPVDLWYIADPAQPWREPAPIRYPAAGTANADVQLALVGLDGTRCAVEWDRQELPYLVDVGWAADEPMTLVTSSRDQRRMVVLAVDEATGATTVMRELSDPDWVEIVPGTPTWVGSALLMVREHDGTRRVMLDDEALTGADVWVRDVVAADENGVVYTASPEPWTVGLYRIDLADRAIECLVEPDGVVAASGGAAARVEVRATLAAAPVYEFVRGTARTRIESHAGSPLVEPGVELFEAGSRRIPTAVLLPSVAHDGPLPILMDPYGGPHAQRVLRSRNAFLASQWLADQGFCVVVADGRGTPGRGDGWERSVRGDLAAPVLEDQLMALDAVIERLGPRVDGGRVGIRGWSFGGYLAALAVLRAPERFHAGVAGAPVTDWRWYDTHYTERYLGHPDAEPDNYERTSLISEAANLERPLLIIHGLADDNVVAAHSLQLSSALLAAGRPHEVLPLSGVTHMTPQEEVAENLLLLQVDFLRRSLPAVS